MVIILLIIVIIFIMMLLVKFLRWSVRLVATPVTILFLLVFISYVFCSSVNIFNSPVYIYKYQKVVKQNYEIAYDDLINTHNINTLRQQLPVIQNSVDLLNEAGSKLPVLGEIATNQANKLTAINSKLKTANEKEAERIIKEDCI